MSQTASMRSIPTQRVATHDAKPAPKVERSVDVMFGGDMSGVFLWLVTLTAISILALLFV